MNADRCLCIDFGNSFTKLALRPDRELPSDYLRCAGLDYDRGLNLCIPTLAVRVIEGVRERWFFGADALDVQQYTPGATFFRDWKRDLFQESESELRQEFGGQVSAGKKKREGRRRGCSVEELDVISRGFFRWVRDFANRVMEERGLGGIGDVVVRISIPSFALGTPEEMRLLSVLSQAGFHLAPSQPTIPEPLANAIGVFSDGRNVAGEQGFGVNYEEMFWGTRLSDVMRTRSTDLSGTPRIFWSLVADLGAYTLDFAMLGFSTTDPQRSLRQTFYGRDRFGIYSEPLGISHLFQRLRDALYPAKRPIFDELIAGRLPEEQTLFFENVFLRRIPFEYRNTGMVIGEGEEGALIWRELQAFALEAAQKMKLFLDHYRYKRVDEVVFTGGGMNIPVIRDALFAVAEQFNATHGFVPSHPEEQLPPALLDRIDQFQVRGATALGGSSLFFDEAVEILNA